MAAATTTTRYVSVPASTIKTDQVLQLNSNASMLIHFSLSLSLYLSLSLNEFLIFIQASLQTNINKDSMNTLSPGVPVKFGDQFFSIVREITEANSSTCCVCLFLLAYQRSN